MTLSDTNPDALAELRKAGYQPSTLDEAIDATMRCFGVGHDAAVFFLTGARDIVVESPPELPHLYDHDDDTREGPSIEADLDTHHFLIPEVWGSYEDGKPLDLGEFGTFDPSGGEGIFGAKNFKRPKD